ncbi:MAG: hypothetical protein COA75_05335 [Cellvibrionales bacterium]|nr:MAG: hypothetical protein COA75_05335 [Cellvibrionales bacterium]
MDPVAYLFSAYLNTIQTVSYNQLSESMGTDISAVVIEHEGVSVPFQFQMWKVKDNSVCANFRQNIGAYSECTVKASELFSKLCSSLALKHDQDWRYKKTKNMYCNAAISYKPTIAHISTATEESEIQRVKKECNSSTIEAMGSNDLRKVNKRDTNCRKYHDLKNRSKE